MSGRGGSSLKTGIKCWSDAQRLGNTVLRLCADYEDIDMIPKLGQRYTWQGEEYVISKLQYAYTDNYIVRMLVEMSKNYTRLNENIALNKKYRQFEIPQDITSRTIHKDIEVNFSTSECQIDEKLENIKWLTYLCFGQSKPNPSPYFPQVPINSIIVKTKALVPHDGSIADVSLLVPTTPLNLGYSAMYRSQMTDNMICGRYRHNNKNYDAFYCGSDGTVENIAIGLSDYVVMPNSDSLPLIAEDRYSLIYEDSFIVKKDPGEALSFEMQIHFLSKDFIISPRLTKIFMDGHKDNVVNIQVRKLTKRINTFTNEVVDISEVLNDGKVTSSKDRSCLAIEGLPSSGTGWAITDEDGKILLAENVDLSTLGGSRSVYVNVKY